MDYNSLFDTKAECQRTLQTLFNFSIDGADLKVTEISSILEPQHDFFECLRYETPYNFEITYKVQLEGKPETATKGTLLIPKMQDGSYLILSHEKLRMRTPVNLLKVEKPVSIFKSGKHAMLSILKTLVIHHFLTDKPLIKFDGAEDSIPFKFVLDQMGIKYSEELDDLPGEVPANGFPELLVNERVRDKLIFAMELELPQDEKSGQYKLSYENLYQIFHYARTLPQKLNSTTPFDLQYSDSSRSILLHFKNNRELRNRMWGFYSRSSQTGKCKLSLTPVQRFVDSYFNMQSDEVNDLQATADTNALEQISQTSKVYLLNFKNEKERLYYTKDFVGVIDPVETPESGNATSIRNALARDVVVKDNKLYIKVRDPKTFKEKEITLLDYYNSKVLTSTSYDYLDHKLVPNKHGKLQIQYKGDYLYIDKDEPFDYLRADKAAMLDYSSATIPFLNRTDATRISMSSASMNMQQVATVGSRPPIVATEVGKEVYEKSPLNIRAKKSGEVIGILDQYVKVKNDDGTTSVYACPAPINTYHKTSSFFNIDVKVGDKVKKDQVIISIDSFKQGQLALTTPAVVAYTNYMGHDFEDGIVITEDFAKRLGHRSETVVDIPIVKSNSYIFDKDILSLRKEYTPSEASEFQYLGDDMLPAIGAKVHPKEMLFTYLYEVDPEENKAARFRRLLNESDIVYQKMVFRVPSNCTDGIIKDIEVITSNVTSPLNRLKAVYDQLHEEKVKEIKDFTGQEPPKPKPTMLSESGEGCIRVKIEYINQVKPGDKIANLYGSKGLITRILKPEETPMREDGTPIDIIFSPESVIGRKNPSQIYEATLGEASVRAWKLAGELLAKKNYSELRKALNILYATDRFSKYTPAQLEAKYKQHEGFFQVIASAYEERYNKDAMFKILDYFKMPRNGLSKLVFPPSERFPNGKVTKNGVVTGVSSIRRLHFIAEFKSKSSSTRTESEEVAMGLGLTKKGGQKIGTQEVLGILSSGNYQLLQELNPMKNKDHASDLNNDLLPLGLRLLTS